MPRNQTRVVRQMRLWFSVFLFLMSVAYFIYGLTTLNILTNIGRPGPGYFPATIGGLLIVFTAVNLVKDIVATRHQQIHPFRIAVMLNPKVSSVHPDEGEEVADRPGD